MKSKKLMKKEPSLIYKLWHYFLALVFDGVQNASSNSAAISLPQSIGSFWLRAKISQSRYAVGLYKDKKGRAIIAKVWQGKRKNLAYFALRHEAMAAKILTRVIKRQGSKMPSRFQSVTLPRYIYTIEDQDRLILVTTAAKGRQLSQTGKRESLAYYDRCVDYMRFLGKCLSKREKETITKKTALDYLVGVSGMTLIALLKQPHLRIQILYGFLIFILSLPALLRSKEMVLIHGDLHTGNMLISRDKITLVDLEQTFFTYPPYEYISTLLCATSKGEIANEISKRIDLESYGDRFSATIFAGLIAGRSLHYLTSNTSRANINLYSKILFFGTRLWQRFSIYTIPQQAFNIRTNLLSFGIK